MRSTIAIAPLALSERIFSWERDPVFLPTDDAGAGGGVSEEVVAPQAGELKSLLATLLESHIGALAATAGVVRLLAPDGHTLQIISSAGLSKTFQDAAESFVELDCEAIDIATFGQRARASDLSTCDSREHCRYARCRLQSLLAAPLESPNQPGVPLGILTLFFDAPREASSKVMNMVAAFAEMMGAVIEHTRINRESYRAARLAARREIANDIHDSLAQTLTFARMRTSLVAETVRQGKSEAALHYADDLDDALGMAQKAVRELIADFRSELSSGGLAASLGVLVDEFRERNAIALEFQNRIVDLALPFEFEIQVFNIVREALNNIARHSGAKNARLFVDMAHGYYVFTIEDNGVGAQTFTPVEGHYGMLIMRERAQRISGNIKVKSAAGQGTQVQLFFPEPTLDWRETID